MDFKGFYISQVFVLCACAQVPVAALGGLPRQTLIETAGAKSAAGMFLWPLVGQISALWPVENPRLEQVAVP